MINFSKKTILIIVLAITAVVLAVFFTLFLLNYLAKQEEIKTQTKINNDLALVQDLIVNKKFAQLDPEVLKNQGLTQPALDLAQDALQKENEKKSQVNLEELAVLQNPAITSQKIQLIMDNEILKLPQLHDIRIKLIELGQPVIPFLIETTKSQIPRDRNLAYGTLFYFAYIENAEKEKIISTYKSQGLKEQDETNLVLTAGNLAYLGDKQGLPILIQYLAVSKSMDYNESYFNLFASSVLRETTGLNYGLNQDKWQDWWLANSEKINWDEDSKKFVF